MEMCFPCCEPQAAFQGLASQKTCEDWFFYHCFLLSQSRWAQRGKRWVSVILSHSLRQPDRLHASYMLVHTHTLVEKTKTNSLHSFSLFQWAIGNGQLFLRKVSLGSMYLPIPVKKLRLNHCLMIVHIFADMVLACACCPSPKQCTIQWMAQPVPNRLDHKSALFQARRSNQKDSNWTMLTDPQDLGGGSDPFCLRLSIYPVIPKPFTFHVTVPYNPLLNGTWEKLLSNHNVSHPEFQSGSSEIIFVRTHPYIKKVQMQL